MFLLIREIFFGIREFCTKRLAETLLSVVGLAYAAATSSESGVVDVGNCGSGDEIDVVVADDDVITDIGDSDCGRLAILIELRMVMGMLTGKKWSK